MDWAHLGGLLSDSLTSPERSATTSRADLSEVLFDELGGVVQQLHAAMLLRERCNADGIARLQLLLQEVAAHLYHVLHLKIKRHRLTLPLGLRESSPQHGWCPASFNLQLIIAQPMPYFAFENSPTSAAHDSDKLDEIDPPQVRKA